MQNVGPLWLLFRGAVLAFVVYFDDKSYNCWPPDPRSRAPRGEKVGQAPAVSAAGSTTTRTLVHGVSWQHLELLRLALASCSVQSPFRGALHSKTGPSPGGVV